MRFSFLSLVFVLAGCMTSPTNGSSVGSTADAVTFHGFMLTPGGTVTLERASSSVGPFTSFATANVSMSASTNLAGVQLYPWATSAVVPTWTGSGCSFETFVRARSGAFFLTTFDRPPPGAENPALCVLRSVNAGTGFLDAVVRCRSPQSPVVRIDTLGTSTYVGDVSVSTQAEADAFACYEVIDGNLTIADDPTELSIAFPALLEVTGDLTIVYSRDATPPPFPGIRDVDLGALERVGGDIALSYPGDNNDLASVDVGLGSLTSAGGDLTLAAQTFNFTASGLDALTTLPGNLTLTSSGDDYSAGGLLQALVHVGGNVELSSDVTTTNVLGTLEQIDGDLLIESCGLAPGQNFHALEQVGGDIQLRGVGFDTPEGFPHQFPSLTSVGGAFDAEDGTAFGELLIGDAAGLSLGALRIVSVGSLSGFSSTWISVDAAGSIIITDNPSVTDCAAEDFVDAIGWPGTPVISGNGGC